METEDNKKLILINISGRKKTPYYCSADGAMVAYVRMGNESVKASVT
jgi:predicted HTH transcriptional regulator